MTVLLFPPLPHQKQCKRFSIRKLVEGKGLGIKASVMAKTSPAERFLLVGEPFASVLFGRVCASSEQLLGLLLAASGKQVHSLSLQNKACGPGRTSGASEEV